MKRQRALQRCNHTEGWLGWVHLDDHCICANILLALLPTRIGSVEPHALKTTARRTESTQPEFFPVHAEAAHLQLARRLLCIAALGARNVKTASWKKVLKFARSRLSATTCRASAALRRLRLTCLPLWQLRQCFSVSVNDIQGGYEYPQVVCFEIEEQDLSSYLRAER